MFLKLLSLLSFGLVVSANCGNYIYQDTPMVDRYDVYNQEMTASEAMRNYPGIGSFVLGASSKTVTLWRNGDSIAVSGGKLVKFKYGTNAWHYAFVPDSSSITQMKLK